MPTTRTHPWLARVQGLLAKAAPTEFPAEAEALVAKAHELMERHAIDDAMLRAAGHGPVDDIVVRTATVAPPYAVARARLLGVVATASHCRLVITGRASGAIECTIVGYPREVEHALATFGTLAVHATREMLATPDPAGRPRSFRHAFLIAYAQRIGERLASSRRAAEAAASCTRKGAAHLALVDRDAAVDRAVAKEFPALRQLRLSVSSATGLRGGRRAADRVALGSAAVTSPRALGRG